MFRELMATTYYKCGCFQRRRANYNGAIASFSKAIRFNPNYTFAYNDRGVAFQFAGEYGLAIADFNQVIHLNPNVADAYYNRGISWKALGDFDRAVADQARAIALDPRHADAYGEHGVAYQLKHEYDLAIASLTVAINLAPRNAIHLKQRGYTRFYQGDFDAAAADLRRALDLGNDAYAMLFHYLARAKTSNKAIVDLEANAKKLKSKEWPAAMIELYLGRCTLDAALTAAVTADQRSEAQFYVGQWHLLRNNRTEAVKALKGAAQDCPPWFVEHTSAIAELKRLG